MLEINMPLKVLLIDDDEDEFVIIQSLLSRGSKLDFELDWIGNYAKGLTEIKQGRHDVYLVDYYLGAISGLELLKAAKKFGTKAPIIILTGMDNKEIDLEVMKAGAADYLVKQQLQEHLLERTIRYSIERMHNLEALQNSEARLRQAQKMEAIGRLTGGIAHDFNNLLTAIIGSAELALDKFPEHHPVSEDILGIIQGSQRAAALVKQLMAFSRQQILQMQTLDLSQVLEKIVNLLRRLIGEDIQISIKITPSLSLIQADLNQLEQVIINLAVNARDSMPDGGELTIETTNLELSRNSVRQSQEIPAGSYVVLTVRDTGHGMSEEICSQIFEPFFTTKEQGKGTGLGLATVYGIVNQSGGFIEVYSTVGVGTTFQIFWPQVKQASEATAIQFSHLTPIIQVKPCTGTILLVEDELLVRQFINRVLKTQGYEVLVAADPAEALAICNNYNTPIDLLLTDITMPQINGRELARQLHHYRPQLPVLFMSGYITGDIEDSAFKADISFLQKPFTTSALLNKVNDLIEVSVLSRKS